MYPIIQEKKKTGRRLEEKGEEKRFPESCQSPSVKKRKGQPRKRKGKKKKRTGGGEALLGEKKVEGKSRIAMEKEGKEEKRINFFVHLRSWGGILIKLFSAGEGGGGNDSRKLFLK